MAGKVLVTGGAGFIGAVAAARFESEGYQVAVVDDFSRPGSRERAALLPGPIDVTELDIRDAARTDAFLESFRPDVVLHEAAQVAVTTSYDDPRRDFDINATGTINVLEATRAVTPEAVFIVASTNKVYGELDGLDVELVDGRYVFTDVVGVSEQQKLDLRTPYGCSKGASDLYTLEWGRSYRMRTVACRQSCIYGEGQFGVEDQGWIAWFTAAAILGLPISIYGDGHQVRDALHVEDLAGLYLALVERADQWHGEVFNVGGGPQCSVSVNEVIDKLRGMTGLDLEPGHGEWRPGDQRCYISDISKAERVLGWAPKIGFDEGLERLYRWMKDEEETLRNVLQPAAAT